MRTRFNHQHLTTQDIRKLEEAMSQEDLEVMVAVVDRIVALRLRASAAAPRMTKAEVANVHEGVHA
jgi:hypothetical protein